MKIYAHKNANHDLLVTFSDRTSEMTDLCIGIQKEWMDSKSPGYLEGWEDRITSQFASHAGRSLSEAESEELAKAIRKAKVTDGVVPKDGAPVVEEPEEVIETPPAPPVIN